MAAGPGIDPIKFYYSVCFITCISCQGSYTVLDIRCIPSVMCVMDHAVHVSECESTPLCDGLDGVRQRYGCFSSRGDSSTPEKGSDLEGYTQIFSESTDGGFIWPK